MVTKVIQNGDHKVYFEDTEEVRDKVFEAVLDFYLRHASYYGECICQSDEPIIDSHGTLADIADDIFKFEVEWE
jgi:hypothetical protein